MENENNIVMSKYAFERMQAKEEKESIIKNVIIILLIILLVVTNAMWLVAWNQYDYVDDYEIEAQQDGEGINIVGAGDVSYGTDSSNTQETEPDTQ